MNLIDRIGLALLLEPMTINDLCSMLHATRKDVAREIRHLTMCQPRLVCVKGDMSPELWPIYYLTRAGMTWAEGAMKERTA